MKRRDLQFSRKESYWAVVGDDDCDDSTQVTLQGSKLHYLFARKAHCRMQAILLAILAFIAVMGSIAATPLDDYVWRKDDAYGWVDMVRFSITVPMIVY
jgi:hypothetical protein